MTEPKLRMGMVGGASGSFIGPVHHMAATLDKQAELVAGTFSRDPAKSRATGEELHLDPNRVYPDWKTMVEAEKALPEDQRIDFVSIVVPNRAHYEICKGFIEAGFNVVCDKPMTVSLDEAKSLRDLVNKHGGVFALTHNYTGYPMVKEARHLCRSGELGKINKVVVQYPQGWMVGFINNPNDTIGIWRMDPKVAGPSCCMGDLGTHAENLARYITGLEIEELCADLSRFIESNQLEDDGNVLIHYKGGARGLLYASQISAGEENPLKIQVYGTVKGLEWRQEDPNYLWIKDSAGTVTRYSRGNDSLCEPARNASRLPWGHPEGFIEGFANLYRDIFKAIRARARGESLPEADFPNVEDGVKGLAFLETVLESSRNKAWTGMKS